MFKLKMKDRVRTDFVMRYKKELQVIQTISLKNGGCSIENSKNDLVKRRRRKRRTIAST